MIKTIISSLFLFSALLGWGQVQTTLQGPYRCHRHCQHGLKSLPADASRSDSLNLIHTELSLDVTEWDLQLLKAHASILVDVLQDDTDRLVFDLEGLTVDSAFIDGNMITTDHENQTLVLFTENILNTGEQVTADIYYSGSPLTDASGWGGVYWQLDHVFNLGVGFEGDPHSYGRVWHPCFDNFAERSTYTIHVLTNEGRTAYSGGLRTETLEVGTDSLLTTWELAESIPSYLASFAVGDYTHEELTFSSTTGEEIPIWLVAEAGNIPNMLTSFQNLIPCLDGFEEAYGPYRWQRIGYVLVPFASGAMEHATNIAYPEFAANGGLGSQTLMAHELAHHWWGDLVTCSTQEDMWINEGMASYCEALFLESLEGYDSYINYVKDNHKDVLQYAHMNDGERLPVSGIGHEHTYGDHVYNKGADIAHTMRTFMGDDYFELMTDFLETYQFEAVSTETLRDFVDPQTDGDMTAFFDGWVFQEGFPEFRITERTITEDNGSYVLDLTVAQFLHYCPDYCENVPVTVSVEQGDEVVEEVVLVGADPVMLTLNLDETPGLITVNRNDELNQACLGEERIVDDGITDFGFAEMRIDLETEGDYFIRIENHWTGADDAVGQPEFSLASDRFWTIYADNDELEMECRARFYGNPDANNYFDPIFFEEMDNANLSEDSLVMVYRPVPGTPWQLVETFDVNTQGNDENYQGYIDFQFEGSGDYAWAYQTGEVSVLNASAERFQLYPNPVTSEILISGNQGRQFEILDASGTLIMSGKINGTINVQELSAGFYFFVTDEGERLEFIKH
ncbi:M1 family aminopeptidase [Sanyastnella coralliicola]|uniref:M1 family aminopeptidase n=1 Tax=Sanyastnella coralliicola TaxID=3069118 RepID=UPI0027B9F713|nr:M1 family aminopeptidase [Longitalea sp. SCSIO 12813]